MWFYCFSPAMIFRTSSLLCIDKTTHFSTHLWFFWRLLPKAMTNLHKKNLSLYVRRSAAWKKIWFSNAADGSWFGSKLNHLKKSRFACFGSDNRSRKFLINHWMLHYLLFRGQFDKLKKLDLLSCFFKTFQGFFFSTGVWFIHSLSRGFYNVQVKAIIWGNKT